VGTAPVVAKFGAAVGLADRRPSRAVSKSRNSGTGKRIVTQGAGPPQSGPVTTEVWRAPDLQLNIYAKQTSSLAETILQYQEIQLGEPDPAVFTIPAGYSVVDGVNASGANPSGAPAFEPTSPTFTCRLLLRRMAT
jgi:hypothetical protein